ncbi:hypothetical protein COCON_G00111980 [Conger conger]|uniref:Uncharacterized protein n=1 Tax=Conger conger TaxID=82655 RepID=A0A9Q1I027_CONCO|nr:hypothetical protein COCON_G00111980 [Conger conger]
MPSCSSLLLCRFLSGFKVAIDEVVELETLHMHSLLRTLLAAVLPTRNVDSGAPVLLIRR